MRTHVFGMGGQGGGRKCVCEGAEPESSGRICVISRVSCEERDAVGQPDHKRLARKEMDSTQADNAE